MGILRFKGNKGHNEVVSHATPLPTTDAGVVWITSESQLPAANTVPVGTFYALVGMSKIWQSKGTSWEEL